MLVSQGLYNRQGFSLVFLKEYGDNGVMDRSGGSGKRVVTEARKGESGVLR